MPPARPRSRSLRLAPSRLARSFLAPPLLAAPILALTSLAAEASPVTYHFHAYTDSQTDPAEQVRAAEFFEILGLPRPEWVRGQLVFDPDAPLVNEPEGDDEQVELTLPYIAFNIEIGGQALATAAEEGEIDVVDGLVPGIDDEISIFEFLAPGYFGFDLGGLDLDVAGPHDSWDAAAMPSMAQLNAVDDRQLRLFLSGDPYGTGFFSIALNLYDVTFSAEPIPLPGSLSAMAPAMAALGALAWRRRRRG